MKSAIHQLYLGLYFLLIDILHETKHTLHMFHCPVITSNIYLLSEVNIEHLRLVFFQLCHYHIRLSQIVHDMHIILIDFDLRTIKYELI